MLMDKIFIELKGRLWTDFGVVDWKRAAEMHLSNNGTQLLALSSI